MKTLIKLIISSYLLIGSSLIAKAGAFPFQDGKYVTIKKLCSMSDDHAAVKYGDRISSMVRVFKGNKIDDLYESSYDVSNVRTKGKGITFDAVFYSEGMEEKIKGSYTYVSKTAFKFRGVIFRKCGMDKGMSLNENKLIAQAESWNDKCRGGSGDDPQIELICTKRDQAFLKANKAGWCNGKINQATYEYKWHKCTLDSWYAAE